jgi:hypothetical protein
MFQVWIGFEDQERLVAEYRDRERAEVLAAEYRREQGVVAWVDHS